MSDLNFDAESGISKEDQGEILRAIEDVATRNRITATPEDFVVKAAKRGVLFPVIVIAASLAALAGGGAGFYFLFQQGQTKIVRGALGTITAEGQLIAAVRQEETSRIAEKNQQISDIQGRLADIDKQRQDLQTNMDAKVQAREQELRAQMATALDAERARLQQQGLTQQVIAQRLADAEKQRNADLQRQMDAFRKAQEDQRALAEKNLLTLQQNFQANLATANAQRQQAVEEAQKREAALKAQFTQNTQNLESARAQAEQALSAIAAQREKEDLVTGQLTGLYGVVRDEIAGHDYEKALTGLSSLRDFVNRADVSTLPALGRRHQFDLFVIDSLTTYVQGEIDKAKVDTATLLQAANQFTLLRQQVGQAQDLLKAGKTEEAEKAYAAALNLIPEVATSYAYFVGRDKEAEAAREQELSRTLDTAEASFTAGDYAATAAAYRKAFAYMPVSSDRLDKAVQNLQTAGAVTGSSAESRSQSQAASGLLAQADNSRNQGRLDDALAGYVNILAKYPLASETRDAIAGIQATVKAMSDTAGATSRAQQSTLSGQVASLQQELTARRADVASLTQRVQEMQTRLDGMNRAYQDYVGAEDPVLKARGDAGLMDTKPYLDGFFQSAAIRQTFPGIAERVRRYDLGFQMAGRSDALQDAITVVINYSRQRTPQLKRDFIQAQLKTYAKDPDMTQLLQEMDQRLASR
ncbi:MAG TPA: hypothetical protein VFI08_12885 [Spirochaetia bacterium]|nr:hypothetical protein [Spirochaetia bacterium]